MTADPRLTNVRCDRCGWEGAPAEAATGTIHYEQHTRDDGAEHTVTVHDYRCPQCGSELRVGPR